jgi:hypothetical protein
MFKNFATLNPIFTLSSVMLKKELITEEVMQTPNDALFDWWFYINISFSENFYYIPEKLTNWRIHQNSYIKNPHRNKFCFVNVLAYINVFKKNPSLELLLFIIKCFFQMCFIRLKVYFIGLIRFIKTILGIKKKKSPIFD